MPRGDRDLRARLQSAALELFRERGYDRTTAADIAARANVTGRTFFRQFPDKREVLFEGQTALSAALAASISDAPDDLAPLEVLFRAFRSVLTLLEENRALSKPRQEVISSTPALAEREAAKHSALGDNLAAALRRRGVEDLPAELAARTGMAAFVYATTAWLDDPTLSLGDRLELAERGLKALW